METCIEYCEPGWAWMSTDERRWINKLRKLAKERPDECVILKQPEDNGGFIYAKFPQKWVRVNPPKVVNLTDEQKAARAEALLKARQEKNEDQALPAL